MTDATMTETTAKIESQAAEARKTAAEQVERAAGSAQDMAAFGQASVEAMMKAAGAAAKSAEEINSEMISFSKKSMEDGMAAAREMAGCRSMKELAEKQGAFARGWMEDWFKQVSRVNELAVNASTEAMEPLARRMSEAAGPARPKQG